MIDQKDANNPVVAAVLAVSREYGVDHIQLFKKSVNKVKFKNFLENIVRLDTYARLYSMDINSLLPLLLFTDFGSEIMRRQANIMPDTAV